MPPDLRRSGTHAVRNDLIIAAHAVETDGIVISHDAAARFGDLPGVAAVQI
jgi:predicted nucleic acid-binding protein